MYSQVARADLHYQFVATYLHDNTIAQCVQKYQATYYNNTSSHLNSIIISRQDMKLSVEIYSILSDNQPHTQKCTLMKAN